MHNIEVEISTFVPSKEWQRLRRFFRKNAKFLGVHRDQTSYFHKDGQLRIRIEPKGAYLVFKSGKMHDAARTEIEITFDRRDVAKMEQLLANGGFPVVVRWFRKREKYVWSDISVTLDDTRGYGTILELEKMAGGREKEKVYKQLSSKLKSLGIKSAPRREMNRRYRYYLKNWK